MSERKDVPYVWVTWITGPVAGDDNCWWALWFKANFRFEKRKRNDQNKLDTWKRDHAEAVRNYAAELERQGYKVYLEGQNEFKLEGKVTGAILAGKPDIVAVRHVTVDGLDLVKLTSGETTAPVEVIVVDVKTGDEREKDRAQVAVYLYAYTKHKHGGFSHGAALRGRVVYPTRSYDIFITDEFRERLLKGMAIATVKHEPIRVPSYRECLFCDISKADCPDRVEEAVATLTEDF